jgi:hypothetical protein
MADDIAPASGRCTPRRSTTSPPSPCIQTGIHDRRAALHRLLGRLRPRQR